MCALRREVSHDSMRRSQLSAGRAQPSGPREELVHKVLRGKSRWTERLNKSGEQGRRLEWTAGPGCVGLQGHGNELRFI